jgi:putative flippase GtrA
MRKFFGSWATKSLLFGALAGAVDYSIGTFLAVVLNAPTRLCAAVGLCFGATFNYLTQRNIAFKGRASKGSFLRWLIVTVLQIAVHGQIVVLLRDRLGVPYVLSKMGGDLLIFSVLQLVLLRYVVFREVSPRSAPEPAESSRWAEAAGSARTPARG